MSSLYLRTNAEAHVYMDRRPSACCDIEIERQSALMDEGGVLCARNFRECRSCGAPC